MSASAPYRLLQLLADVPPLHIFTVFKDTRFEFIFTPVTRTHSHMLLQTVELLTRAFTATSRVREVRMRGAHHNSATPMHSQCYSV